MKSSTKLKPLQNSPERTRKIANLIDLYDYAAAQGYDVFFYHFTVDGLDSLSVQDSDQHCYIAMDPFKVSSSADEFCKGLHEIGHCDTGSFYNRETPFDIRQKHENIADKRAIELCISADELHAAQENGYTEIWELAEHFGVTEDFMQKAICWYTHGNLATEWYI